MQTPLERAKDAIGGALGMHLDVSDCGYDSCIDRAARAVLEAIREPSEAMLEAGFSTPDIDYDCPDIRGTWEAMLDTAIKGE